MCKPSVPPKISRSAACGFPASSSALGLIKKSAAQVNADLGILAADLAEPIIRAAGAVAEGSHDDQFVLDIFQTGSGTSTNMNANEVIAGRANEAKSGVRGGCSPIHPNDAVNMSQSSNDVIPTALYIAALHQISYHLVPALGTLHDRLARRAEALDDVIKTGRTHLQDAVPVRLDQEFGGYATAVEHGIKRVEGMLRSTERAAHRRHCGRYRPQLSSQVSAANRRSPESRNRPAAPAYSQSL